MKYNLNEWYGWSGTDCPVHPKSKVQWLTKGGVSSRTGEAGNLVWDYPYNPILAFKVVEEYKEPKEFWLVRDSKHGEYMAIDRKPTVVWNEVIHVREVKDE